MLLMTDFLKIHYEHPFLQLFGQVGWSIYLITFSFHPGFFRISNVLLSSIIRSYELRIINTSLINVKVKLNFDKHILFLNLF